MLGVATGGLLDRVTGTLVPVGDAEAMAAAILPVATDREGFGARARTHAETHYSWLCCFESVVSQYRALGVAR